MEITEAITSSKNMKNLCLLYLDDEIKTPEKLEEEIVPKTITVKNNKINDKAEDNINIIEKMRNLTIAEVNTKKDNINTMENMNNLTTAEVDTKEGNINVIEKMKNLTIAEVDTREDKICTKSVLKKPEIQNLCMPQTFMIGQAVTDGNCFFDSIRQGLQPLGIDDTIDSLRQYCKEFAENYPPVWFLTAIGNSHQHNSVRQETPQEYVANIQRSDRWGDPEVEGRIICKYYGIVLYLIEIQQVADENLSNIYQLIDKNGSMSISNVDFGAQNAVFIINRGQGHFEPVIKKSSQIYNLDNKPFASNPYNKPDIQKDEKNLENHGIHNICSVTRRLVIEAYNKLEDAIKHGDIKRLTNLIKFLYNTADKTSLKIIYEDDNNNIRNTHLITLACKHNQPLVLDFLLHKTNILCYLPDRGSVVERAYRQALYETIQSVDSQMLEMLYDYWSGKLHWLGLSDNSKVHDVIDNLKQLKSLLVEARDSNHTLLDMYPQMLVDVHSLISYNSFQIELYTKLSKLKTNTITSGSDIEKRKKEVERIIAVLLIAFETYEEYSNKNIRLSKYSIDEEIKIQKLLHDNSIYMKYLMYYMYEMYYRKLDYNIALLIINNLHLLKGRLDIKNTEKLPENTYQKIESTLYYFLYRVNSDWDLYLHENRPKKIVRHCIGSDNKGFLMITKCVNDLYRLIPVIYLERQKYVKSLNEFKVALEKVDLENNLREKGKEIPNEEIHDLSLLPYMRDDYSLKKILQYIEHVGYLDFKKDKENDILIVQRIIQITGEFLKCSKESDHLSPTTLALLLVEIPKDTVKHLRKLRDFLSKAKGEAKAKEWNLSKRIYLEQNFSEVFQDVLKDLEEIKKVLNEVIKVNKPILEKYLLQSGKLLINGRYDELPKINLGHMSYIQGLYDYIQHINHEVFMTMENSFMKRTWQELGFTRQLLREIGSLADNNNQLQKQLYERKKESIMMVTTNLPKYTKTILETTHTMKSQIEVWNSIKEDLNQIQTPLPITVSSYPNTKCIESIGSGLKQIKKQTMPAEILWKLSTVQDWNEEWLQIRKLLMFIVEEVDYFRENHWEIKRSMFTKQSQRIDRSEPDSAAIEEVIDLVHWINSESKRYQKNGINYDTNPTNKEPHEYKGLKILADAMLKKLFLTTYELDYLKNNTKCVCDCDVNKSCNHRALIKKLHKNTIIGEKEYLIVSSLKIDDKCKKIIKNLVNVKSNNNMLEYLVNRTKLLKTLLERDELNNLIERYRHDPKFRITIEMLLSDIMNIYKESQLRKLVNMHNCTKLLSEYSLRNLLDHGNAILEVSSSALDANDLPTALMTFALSVVNDEIHINRLFELYKDGVKLPEVMANLCDKLNDTQQNLVEQFKSNNDNWEIYVTLLE